MVGSDVGTRWWRPVNRTDHSSKTERARSFLGGTDCNEYEARTWKDELSYVLPSSIHRGSASEASSKNGAGRWSRLCSNASPFTLCTVGGEGHHILALRSRLRAPERKMASRSSKAPLRSGRSAETTERAQPFAGRPLSIVDGTKLLESVLILGRIARARIDGAKIAP